MSKTISVLVVATAAALLGGAAGAAIQRNADAQLMVTGDQLNRLTIVGNCPIERGDRPFANCSAKKLTGVVK